MIPVTFRPLIAWQGEETPRRRRSQFSAGFTSTMEVLDRELRQLSAQNVVIQIDVMEDDIRLDGWPRSSVRPDHPGVALSFESKYGPLRYSCDRFDRWQDNLRAIALGLEALRKVDRYGITKSGEQYTGWRQLTAGSSLTSRDQAVELIGDLSNLALGPNWFDSDELTRKAYRQALKYAHPDGGGDSDLFAAVQDAGRLLGVGGTR